jgi:hypothetical protein
MILRLHLKEKGNGKGIKKITAKPFVTEEIWHPELPVNNSCVFPQFKDNFDITDFVLMHLG